jgi:hypothetical protein
MRKISLLVSAITLMAASAASAVPVAFSKLTGTTGGSPAGTAVFKADLSTAGLGSILSISISDSNSGSGGSSGEFTGFDLDAIKLSTTDCADAACAAAAVGLNVFNFAGGSIFTPGTQRAPADAKLWGTNGAGTGLDNAVATLGLFDADSSTSVPDGFISLGDGGSIGFNLLAAADTTGLFLYIGEVGDNGELAAGGIIVRDDRIPIPTPSTLALVGLGVLALAFRRRGARA